MKKLFEVAVIRRKKPSKDGKPDAEEIIVNPKPVLAIDMETAKLEAARDLDREIDLSEVEIIARPF